MKKRNAHAGYRRCDFERVRIRGEKSGYLTAIENEKHLQSVERRRFKRGEELGEEF